MTPLKLAVTTRTLALLIAWTVTAQAQSLRLGEIEFPTSARSSQAQQHFLRGVAAMHSFWYPVARDEFQRAAKVEPDFAMAYWGEAMTHNHPVWGDPQDTEAGRAAIRKIGERMVVSARERGYIEAVRTLYGDGDRPARDKAYAAAMEALHERFPRDVEATLFYALAMLGTGDEASRLRAGALAMKVFKARPDHPGAAHYAIHAYDDPRHARLALPAARRYAEIAPDAGHALHMPSHIFLQLGMWDQAAASNERSWSASSRWVREHARPVTELDIHSLHWLLYVYLQQGRNQQAEALLRTMRETLAGFPKDDPQMLAFATYTQAMMAATYLIETEQWQRAQEILGPPPPDVATQPFVAIANSPATFARGMAAAVAGSADEARKSAETLRTLRTPPEAAKLPYIAGIVAATRVQAQMIDATAAASRQDFASALDVARQAAAAAARTTPPPGPPPVVKPPHELLGDIALKAGEQKAARESYRIALSRHQGRARSLLGAARAAAAGGNARQSRSFYGTLRKQWRGDATLPALGAAK